MKGRVVLLARVYCKERVLANLRTLIHDCRGQPGVKQAHLHPELEVGRTMLC